MRSLQDLRNVMLPLRNQSILNDLSYTKIDGITTTTCNWTEDDLPQTSFH